MKQADASSWVQRVGALLLGGVLAALVYAILAPFLSAILWAALLAYASWPAYRRLRARMGGRKNLSAVLAVLVLTVALVLPMLWLAILVKDDLVQLYNAGIAWLRQPQPQLAAMLARVPVIGASLSAWLGGQGASPDELRQYLGRMIAGTASWSIGLLGDIGRNTVKIVLSLTILFFFYRDGEAVQAQVQKALRYLIGHRSDAYVGVAARMSRVIVQSALLAALLQGLAAGIGYWIVGARAPALLSMATALASLVPFVGTALVWGSVAVSFLAAGEPWRAMGMLAWGVLAVHPIDNIVRPALISSSSRTPFFLVLFGVLGGIGAFGLIGVFLGPVILTIAAAVWKEWVGALPERGSRMDY